MKLRVLWRKKGFIWRYFRDGFSIYISLPLSLVSFLTITYSLLLERVDFLKAIFPSMGIYAVTCLLILVPTGVIIGWLHFKRSGLYGQEQELAVESNPISARQLNVSYRNVMDTRRFQYAVLKKLKVCDKEIMAIMGIAEKQEIVELGEFYATLDNRWKWTPTKK